MEGQMAVPNVADRAAAYGITGVVVDGNDILAVYDAVYEAAQRAYSGGGPTLIEAKTYRLVPHSSDDDDRSYRSREEVESWKKKDPILRFERDLLDAGLMTADQRAAYETRARAVVDRAQAAAEAAPDPAPHDALGDVYAV
jgi:2-oxoisovalerate dehydrogenase E1 component alpha subunit